MACSKSFDGRKVPFVSQRVNDVLRNTNVFTHCKFKMQIPYHRSGRLWTGGQAQSPGNPREIDILHTPTYAFSFSVFFYDTPPVNLRSKATVLLAIEIIMSFFDEDYLEQCLHSHSFSRWPFMVTRPRISFCFLIIHSVDSLISASADPFLRIYKIATQKWGAD